MNETTYYTVRICAPGQAALAQKLGHNFEYNHSELDTARAYFAAIPARFGEYDYHLLQTTVTVLDTVKASK